MVLPAVALAQGPKNDAPQGQGQGPGGWDPVRAEKRMRLARTVGLAEVLDLDTEAALKLNDQMTKFDERRKAIRKQAMDARDVIRNAARGGKATGPEVDGAIAKVLDARSQLLALDKEMLQAITQGLSPEKKARAAIFLARFRERIEQHVMEHRHGPGMGGPGGPGHDDGARWNMRGMRAGPGMPGPGPGFSGGDRDDDHLARGPAGDPDDAPPFSEDFEED
jgi:hypothetical protein